MWQACPICKGLGKVDTEHEGRQTCTVCNGRKIIGEITGLPPTLYQGGLPFGDSGDFRDNCEQFKDK